MDEYQDIRELTVPVHEPPNINAALSLLESDLGFNLDKSKQIPKPDREKVTKLTKTIARRLLAQNKKYVPSENYAWLLDVADSVYLLDELDMRKLFAFEEAISLEDKKEQERLLNVISTEPESLPEQKAVGIMWEPPIKSERKIRFILYNHNLVTQKEGIDFRYLMYEVAGEELLHALDQMDFETYLGQEYSLWKMHEEQLHEAIARLYLLDLISYEFDDFDFILAQANVLVGAGVLEHEFDADELKKFFFTGSADLDVKKLLRRAKEIWGQQEL